MVFFGMGGCPMIAQTLVNLSAGSRARLSGIVAALAILVIILFGAPVIELLPIAALVGVMIMVAIGTFEWISFRIINKMPKHDIFVGVLVAIITILLHNLALAVLIGVIISALVLHGRVLNAFVLENTSMRKVKHYEIYGPLFSTTAFAEKFDVIDDPEEVIVDFRESKISDMSAIDAVHKLTERYAKAGKKLHLRYLSADCRQLLHAADDVIDINIIEDPTYKVVSKKKTDLMKIQVCFFLHQKISVPLIKRSRNHIPWEMELRIT
jgi:SulP family sulfate permease